MKSSPIVKIKDYHIITSLGVRNRHLYTMSIKPFQNRSKLSHVHNNIYVKKLNRILLTNSKLRKCIAALRIQNKSLSAARNVTLLENVKLKNERNAVKNANNQLTALLHTCNRKLVTLEYDIQACVPALVTLSNYIPLMMNSVREISKLNKFSEFKNGKTERLSESIKRMVIMVNTTPIAEIPEHCSPMSAKKSSSPILQGQVCSESPAEPHPEPQSDIRSEINLKPHAKLSVSPEDDSSSQVSSWPCFQRNQTQNADIDSSVTTVSESSNNYYSAVMSEVSTLVGNKVTTPIPNEISAQIRKEETTTSNAVQVDILSASSSNSDGCASHTCYENEIHDHEKMSLDPNMLKNITIRRYRKQTSNY